LQALDVQVASVKTSEKLDIVWDNNNFNKSSQSTDVGSTISGGGNVALRAGQTLQATVANVQASGALNINAGTALPKTGLLVIVGEPKAFAETANFARDRGLNVDVMAPVPKDGSRPLVNESLSVAPSSDPATKLQTQIQNDSNTQMNQLLQGVRTHR